MRYTPGQRRHVRTSCAAIGVSAVVLMSLAPSAFSAGPRCTITGTPGHDSLGGTNRGDVICGLGGDDFVFAGGGGDVVLAGPGDDSVSGEDGNDVLRGERGHDSLNGDEGSDVLRGGPGRDFVDGGDGRDIVRGDAGNDVLSGGSVIVEDDECRFSRPGCPEVPDSFADIVRGDRGFDFCFREPGDIRISCERTLRA